MAVCSVQELFDESACFDALMPGQWEVAKLALLCQILQALDPVASCDIQSLMEEGSCFFALKGGEWRVAELQLLCNISAALGGGAGAACPVFSTRRTGTFADPNGNVLGCPGEVYVNTSTGALWKKLSGENTNTGWSV